MQSHGHLSRPFVVFVVHCRTVSLHRVNGQKKMASIIDAPYCAKHIRFLYDSVKCLLVDAVSGKGYAKGSSFFRVPMTFAKSYVRYQLPLFLLTRLGSMQSSTASMPSEAVPKGADQQSLYWEPGE